MTSQEFIDFAKSKVQEWLLCRLKYDPNCLLAADADRIDDIFFRMVRKRPAKIHGVVRYTVCQLLL